MRERNGSVFLYAWIIKLAVLDEEEDGGEADLLVLSGLHLGFETTRLRGLISPLSTD